MEPDQNAGWRAVHGGLFLLCLPIVMVFPKLARWPWYLVAPLAAYAMVVCAVGPLRWSVSWLQVGRLDGRVLLVTAGIILITSPVLVLFYVLSRPNLQYLVELLPMQTILPVVLAAAYFSLFNALLEEIIFRGVLMDAFESQLGATGGVLVQAVAFGSGHAQGYPPGELGVVLAAVYGLALGLLRLWAGGLAAPLLAHICADATIFAIVLDYLHSSQ